MIVPKINSYVKILLKNQTKIEGVVQQWSNEQVVLTNSSNDIILINKIHEEASVIVIVNKSDNKIKLENEVKEIKNKSNKSIDDLKSLAELKKELAIEEQKDISEKLKKIEISSANGVNYGFPGFFKKRST